MRTAIVTKLLRPAQVIAIAQVDAPFALHHFQHHHRRLVGDHRIELFQIIVRHMADFKQRLEGLAIFGFPGQRDRADGAPMKTTHGSDQAGTSCGQPRKLDRAINRLRPTVGQKNMVKVGRQHFDQPRREFGPRAVVEKTRAGD